MAKQKTKSTKNKILKHKGQYENRIKYKGYQNKKI